MATVTCGRARERDVASRLDKASRCEAKAPFLARKRAVVCAFGAWALEPREAFSEIEASRALGASFNLARQHGAEAEPDLPARSARGAVDPRDSQPAIADHDGRVLVHATRGAAARTRHRPRGGLDDRGGGHFDGTIGACAGLEGGEALTSPGELVVGAGRRPPRREGGPLLTEPPSRPRRSRRPAPNRSPPPRTWSRWSAPNPNGRRAPRR